MYDSCYDSRYEPVSLLQSLTTTAGLLQTRLASFFAVLGSIPGFIRKINRITVRHRRRDVICLAHHGRQSVWQHKSPSSSVAWICEVCKRNRKKILLLRLTQASWLHAKGTSLQKQVYRGRTVLYIVGITRGSLLPSSWPLCLCVALPHPLCVALRKASCDKSFFCFVLQTPLLIISVGNRLSSTLEDTMGAMSERKDKVLWYCYCYKHHKQTLTDLISDSLTQMSSAPVRCFSPFSSKMVEHLLVPAFKFEDLQLFLIINEEYLGFRLLVGQKKLFKYITLGSGKPKVFLLLGNCDDIGCDDNVDTLYRLNKLIV